MATATSGKQTLPAINQQTWRQRISSYKRTPLSFLLFLLVSLSAMANSGGAGFIGWLYF